MISIRSLVGSLLSQALITDWLMVLWEKWVVLLPPERRGKEGRGESKFQFSLSYSQNLEKHRRYGTSIIGISL